MRELFFTRGPKDRAKRNIWLADYLVGRGVLEEVSEKRKQYALGRRPEGNFLVGRAPNEAFTLGLIIGNVMRKAAARRGPLDEEELTLLATCATPQHTANALQVELHIFQDWFERSGVAILRHLDWSDKESLRLGAKQVFSSRGHEAIYSAKLKFVGYRSNRVHNVIDRCSQQLWLANPVSATKWDSYWKALLQTDRKREIETFDPLIGKAAVLNWQVASCLSAVEIAIRYKQFRGDAAFLDNLERAFQKLRDFRREMGSCGVSEPSLVTAISNRFQRMEILKQTEFTLADGELAVSDLHAKNGEFNPNAALAFALQHLEQLMFDVSLLMQTVEPLVESFGRAADRYDFKHMLYYDIVDSTATRAGKAGVDVEQYRQNVRAFNSHFGDNLERKIDHK